MRWGSLDVSQLLQTFRTNAWDFCSYFRPPLNPRLDLSVLCLQETPSNNENHSLPLTALYVKSILSCSTKRGSSLITHVTEPTFMTRQTLTGLDFDTKQIYGLTSILREGGLVQISLSRWTPPCPGVASEPPQTADGWAATRSRPRFSLCDCPQSSELCPETEKHTLLTSCSMQNKYIF